MQEQLLAVDTGPLVLRDPCDECGWNANGVKAEAAAVALAQPTRRALGQRGCSDLESSHGTTWMWPALLLRHQTVRRGILCTTHTFACVDRQAVLRGARTGIAGGRRKIRDGSMDAGQLSRISGVRGIEHQFSADGCPVHATALGCWACAHARTVDSRTVVLPDATHSWTVSIR